MSKKIFLVDVARCNGCHNCQIACNDEHCGTSWLLYAAEQPDFVDELAGAEKLDPKAR